MKKSELKALIKEEINQHQKDIVEWFRVRWKDYSINQLKAELNKAYSKKETKYLIPMIKDLINQKRNLKTTLKEWNPNNPFDAMGLTDKADLQNISTIQSFVEYHHLPKIITDICKYAASELNVYPYKITQNGMVFPAKDTFDKVELEFKKDGKINLYKFKGSTLKEAHPFSYNIFKDMITK